MEFKVVLMSDSGEPLQTWKIASELDLPDSEDLCDAITCELEQCGYTMANFNRGET